MHILHLMYHVREHRGCHFVVSLGIMFNLICSPIGINVNFVKIVVHQYSDKPSTQSHSTLHCILHARERDEQAHATPNELILTQAPRLQLPSSFIFTVPKSEKNPQAAARHQAHTSPHLLTLQAMLRSQLLIADVTH